MAGAVIAVQFAISKGFGALDDRATLSSRMFIEQLIGEALG
jgi:hypothetical protein